MTSLGQCGSTGQLGTPDGWRKPERGLWQPLTFLGVLACLAAAIVALVMANVGVAIGFGVMVVVLVIALVGTRPSTPRGRVDVAQIDMNGHPEWALRLPISTVPIRTTIMLSVLGLGLVGAAIFSLVAGFVRGQPVLLLATVIAGGLGAVFLAAVFAVLRESGSMAGLYLGFHAVVLAAGRNRIVVPWSQIKEIRATQIEYKLGLSLFHPIQNWLVIAVHDPDAVLGPARQLRSRLTRRFTRDAGAAGAASSFGIDPVLAYHALGHYLAHARDRSELTSEAAVQRVYDGRLSVATEPAD